jgi:hypothetical protein
MTQLSRPDLLERIDILSSDVIERCHADADGWNEDRITIELLDQLNKLNGDEVLLRSGKTIPLHFDAYKQRGTSEHERGDIALIIARDDRDYGFIGVAFIEAKKRHDTDGTFAAVDSEQLARIVSNEPASVLALYDYLGEPYADAPVIRRSPFQVATLPARQVLSDIGRLNKLCRHATTLGFQFALRYLEGADMDLSADAAVAIARARQAKFIARLAIGEQMMIELKRHQYELERYDNIVRVMEQIRENAYNVDIDNRPRIDNGYQR